ncbi:MAG: LamG domain-containing protein [Candidatus Muirbacterium halophilum]|nr:LamG domain-containing protein [Candidatus Muirbacterium halophilum]
MANGIKFSSIEEGALRIGNANIAVRQNSVSNPSSYWTSIEPVNGGYTVYIDKPENGPAVYNANSDAELIALGNKLSGQSFANINQCLTWFNSYEPGNRNYLIDSNRDFNSSNYNISWYYFGSYKPQQGEQVTIQIKGQLGADRSYFGVYNSGGMVGVATLSPVNYNNGIYTKTFNWNISTSTNTYLNLYHMYSSGTSNSTIDWVKLEKGSTATPWRPAMEDPEYTIDKFVLSSEIPPIVTDGLVLNYDAGLIPSYPRGGTVINDVSGFGNNGTLVNGVGYSSDGGGSLSFDGVNDYVQTPIKPDVNSLTITMWVKSNSISSNKIFLNGSTSPYTTGRFYFAIYNGKWNMGIGGVAWGSGIVSATTDWTYITILVNNNIVYMYVNNILNRQLSSNNVILSKNISISDTNYPWDGNIGQILIYNRALTQQEILQNYYAGLQKFIPKDGLVLSLSPQNSHFSGSAITSVRDISGNGNDGSINNGVAYVREGGGSWSFDGVNDFIDLGSNAIAELDNYSISMWIDFSKVSDVQYFIGGTSTSNGSIRYSSVDNTLLVYISGAPSFKWIAPNGFVNFVMVRNSTSSCDIYIDGILKSTLTGLSGKGSFRYMGGRSNGYYFNGNIGQTLVYNRALLESEIQTIYDATKSKYNTPDINLFAYGVKQDLSGDGQTLIRVGNSELHRSLPIQSKMRGCLLNDDGTVNYYLSNDSDLLKEDGITPSVLDGTDGNVMTEIPSFYVLEKDMDGFAYTYISDQPLPGFKYIPKTYHGRYEATKNRNTGKLMSIINTSTTYRGGNNTSAWDGTYRSLLGLPCTTQSRTVYRTGARLDRSSNWNISTTLTDYVVALLFRVEYATYNSQATFNSTLTAEGYKQGGLGAGVTNINSTLWSSYNGYNPFIPCGYTAELGNRTGVKDFVMPSEYGTLTTQVNRYRGIELPFGHIWKHRDGFVIELSENYTVAKYYIFDNPDNFTDTKTANTRYLCDMPSENGYIKTLNKYTNIASTIGGSSGSWSYDYAYVKNDGAGTLRGFLSGGDAYNGSIAGLGCSNALNSPTNASVNIGARLCYNEENIIIESN